MPARAVASSAPDPISIDQYKSELKRIENAIVDQRDHSQPPKGHAESLNADLPSAWHVEVHGQTYDVPSAQLNFYIQEDSEDAANRVAIMNADLARVRALEAEAARFDAAPEPQAADAARAKLDEILRQKEFGQSQEKKSWIRELWERMIEWVLNLFRRLINVVRANKPVRSLVLYGVIAIGFIALAWILLRVLGGVARRENLKLESPAFSVKTSGQWVREAMAAASRGDYREAIHCGYWAGVYRLAETGIWELDESRTPREYLRLLSAPPRSDGDSSPTMAPGWPVSLPDPVALAARTQALSALTRSFESVWYADEPATQQDFSSAVAQLEKLECRLPSTAPTAGS